MYILSRLRIVILSLFLAISLVALRWPDQLGWPALKQLRLSGRFLIALSPNWRLTSSSKNGEDYSDFDFIDRCDSDAKWPDLELYLTTPASENGEFEYSKWFLPSLSLFWPITQRLKLLIVTDLDDSRAPTFTQRAELLAQHANPNIDVRSVLTPRAFPCAGWDKAQWLKLWADNFTNATFVGFVDTDSVFVTRIARSDLFVGNKPILRPIYGKPRQGWSGNWQYVPANTFKYTGLKEPFNCMSFFPVIVKTEHLRFVREIIVRRLNGTSFDHVFGPIASGGYNGFYSEYNMICAVLWWHFRDDYFWVINETEPGWNGTAPEGQVANLVEAGIAGEMLERSPRPHLTLHYTYYPGAQKVETLTRVLKRGVCYSMIKGENNQIPLECLGINRTATVNADEFIFEYDNFSGRPGAYAAHIARLARNEACPHDWNIDRVDQLFNIIHINNNATYYSSY